MLYNSNPKIENLSYLTVVTEQNLEVFLSDEVLGTFQVLVGWGQSVPS